MTRHCTAYESKHRTLKTTYQEMIILVNRVRHPRVQGKTCTKRGKEKSSSQSEKEIHASISKHLRSQVENWLSNKSIG